LEVGLLEHALPTVTMARRRSTCGPSPSAPRSRRREWPATWHPRSAAGQWRLADTPVERPVGRHAPHGPAAHPAGRRRVLHAPVLSASTRHRRPRSASVLDALSVRACRLL